MENENSQQAAYLVYPIGIVQRKETGVILLIDPDYRGGLTQLEHFSHVTVVWWANRHDNPTDRGKLQTVPPYAPGHLTGVFACRSPYRPNPIAITTCKILEVNEEQGTVRVANIDALDGTPILDLKAYFPASDRVRQAAIPDWLVDWPEWMPEEGLGLY
jgi:tRNA (adenine37-N6)-methyltransferase